jgi:16S rRNA (guanine1207-N2)-methyltransferase
MSPRPPARPFELLTDEGVLDSVPTLEVFGSAGVAEVGGEAVLPHRGEWLRARERGLSALGWFDDAPRPRFSQAVVHLQKGRDATQEGLAHAWHQLGEGGRLLLAGGNDLGIKSAVKRLSAALGQPVEIVANRARARVACWRKNDDTIGFPSRATIEVATPTDIFVLRSAPGVFSADAIDTGSALLLEHLEEINSPKRIYDPGCGLGVLGLSALRRWPDATAVLADVDRRAVDCAQRNADMLGLTDRCRVAWWDAVSEQSPTNGCDLVLLNPPFHSGVPVDLQPARAIFATIDAALVPGGRALIVANRTLPWEHDLRKIGALHQIDDRFGFKVLDLRR